MKKNNSRIIKDILKGTGALVLGTALKGEAPDSTAIEMVPDITNNANVLSENEILAFTKDTTFTNQMLPFSMDSVVLDSAAYSNFSDFNFKIDSLYNSLSSRNQPNSLSSQKAKEYFKNKGLEFKELTTGRDGNQYKFNVLERTIPGSSQQIDALQVRPSKKGIKASELAQLMGLSTLEKMKEFTMMQNPADSIVTPDYKGSSTPDINKLDDILRGELGMDGSIIYSPGKEIIIQYAKVNPSEEVKEKLDDLAMRETPSDSLLNEVNYIKYLNHSVNFLRDFIKEFSDTTKNYKVNSMTGEDSTKLSEIKGQMDFLKNRIEVLDSLYSTEKTKEALDNLVAKNYISEEESKNQFDYITKVFEDVNKFSGLYDQTHKDPNFFKKQLVLFKEKYDPSMDVGVSLNYVPDGIGGGFEVVFNYNNKTGVGLELQGSSSSKEIKHPLEKTVASVGGVSYFAETTAKDIIEETVRKVLANLYVGDKNKLRLNLGLGTEFVNRTENFEEVTSRYTIDSNNNKSDVVITPADRTTVVKNSKLNNPIYQLGLEKALNDKIGVALKVQGSKAKDYIPNRGSIGLTYRL